jgi:hypothetical protein
VLTPTGYARPAAHGRQPTRVFLEDFPVVEDLPRNSGEELTQPENLPRFFAADTRENAAAMPGAAVPASGRP